MKVSKGKKLVIFFGGTACPKDEKDLKEETIQGESTKRLRKKMIEGLNQSKEVHSVSDLFPEGLSYSYFDPNLL